MGFAATRRSGMETTIGKFAGFQSPDDMAGFELSCSLAAEQAVLHLANGPPVRGEPVSVPAGG
jgi:hypothetical protein